MKPSCSTLSSDCYCSYILAQWRSIVRAVMYSHVVPFTKYVYGTVVTSFKGFVWKANYELTEAASGATGHYT